MQYMAVLQKRFIGLLWRCLNPAHVMKLSLNPAPVMKLSPHFLVWLLRVLWPRWLLALPRPLPTQSHELLKHPYEHGRQYMEQ